MTQVLRRLLSSDEEIHDGFGGGGAYVLFGTWTRGGVGCQLLGWRYGMLQNVDLEWM